MFAAAEATRNVCYSCPKEVASIAAAAAATTTGDRGTALSSMAISRYYLGVAHLCPEVLPSVGSDLVLQPRLVEGVRHFFVPPRRDAPAPPKRYVVDTVRTMT